jgi:hypothetical protein
MKKKSNKKKGQKFEEKVRKTINSGALWFNKGDLETDDYLIECKHTEKKGFRISTKLLEKLWDEALSSNKLPFLVIEIEGENEIFTIKADIEKKIK